MCRQLHKKAIFRSSLEELLDSRQNDAEELLLNLGFGGQNHDDDPINRIPVRFLEQQSEVSCDVTAGFILPHAGKEERKLGFELTMVQPSILTKLIFLHLQ